MIVETIFSTLDEGGKPNFAPMGVLWGEEEITLRPFRQTLTYHNLMDSGYGVVNLTDDVLAFVQSGLFDAVLPNFPAQVVPGVVFQGACSWRELKVIKESGSTERAEVRCQVVGRGWQRDFLGFCRARSAVIEAAILATRLHLYEIEEVFKELERYERIVEKTGDETERIAIKTVHELIMGGASAHHR